VVLGQPSKIPKVINNSCYYSYIMRYELDEIRIIRKKLGISQIELSQHAAVSQSLIAKIESGNLDPSYSKAKRIFEALDILSKQKSLKADEVMQKGIISVCPDDSINEAVRKMKRHQISQMPVIQDNKSVGMISESSILESLMNNKGQKVRDVMVEAAPVVSKETTIEVLSNLLRFYPMVLVSEKGRLIGLITKSDIISKI